MNTGPDQTSGGEQTGAANPPWLPAEQAVTEQAVTEQAVTEPPTGQPLSEVAAQWTAPVPPDAAQFAPAQQLQPYRYPQQASPQQVPVQPMPMAPQPPHPGHPPLPQQQLPQQPLPQQPLPQQPDAAPQWGAPTPPPAKLAPGADLNLLRRAKRPPRSGWRKLVHRISGGRINPGESPADIAYRELVDRVNQPIRGDYRIAFLSLKGGVGKTTTTVGLGATFASLRGDRVIAVDANPDLGTLAQRVPSQTTSTVRNLLEDPNLQRYSDVRAHTSQAPSRLEVLASEKDPAVSEAFSENDYRSVVKILQAYYNIILTDCGTGLMHSAMNGALDTADALVLVSSPAIDGARSASATLDWLDHHGYGELVKRSIVVVNSARRGASSIDLDQLKNLFLGRCRAVHVVPYDEHLAEGAEIDLDLIGKTTRRSFLELAAIVADGFTVAAPRPEPGREVRQRG
ncbi:MinD/ParA family protein [Rhodococcus sp. D2-41]|uniref:AAA family ATPase n=1 Tax=Speluncibacter jeojiensis TaxID=2710754 RepID=UPI00241083F0|nr:AAA family ATPase [Rhodococcus sp. D2-41]MDG3008745.1 MinD/ParA family protein [Rhodococcus sp. D2-41]